jgi:hypothetical protein
MPLSNPRTLKTWDDVPKFTSRREEAEYWSTTTVDTRLVNDALVKPEIRESTTITLRLDPRMLSRLKRMARSRFLNYQSMMKQWLSERMEEELARGHVNNNNSNGPGQDK